MLPVAESACVKRIFLPNVAFYRLMSYIRVEYNSAQHRRRTRFPVFQTD